MGNFYTCRLRRTFADANCFTLREGDSFMAFLHTLAINLPYKLPSERTSCSQGETDLALRLGCTDP